MKIQINTDNNIDGHLEMVNQYEEIINDSLKRFESQITRIEAHLGDINSIKEGPNDKRCMIEARLENLRPVAVTHQAENLPEAVKGALDKMKRSLETTIGKRKSH